MCRQQRKPQFGFCRPLLLLQFQVQLRASCSFHRSLERRLSASDLGARAPPTDDCKRSDAAAGRSRSLRLPPVGPSFEASCGEEEEGEREREGSTPSSVAAPTRAAWSVDHGAAAARRPACFSWRVVGEKEIGALRGSVSLSLNDKTCDEFNLIESSLISS